MVSIPKKPEMSRNGLGSTDYEKSVARRRMVETWPLACDMQQEFVEIARPFVKTDDLLLLEKWTIWRWSYDPEWDSHKVIEVDILEEATTLIDRLKELFDEFKTLWKTDLGLDGFVIGETYSREPKKPGPEKVEWEWRTLADAYAPKPPREYVIEGLLPLHSLTIVFGNPGDLKTMLSQDMGLCVTAGKPWLEGRPGQGDVKPFACKRSPVLWVDVDNGLDRTERRFAALGKAHGVPADAPLAYISFPVPPFVASSKKSIDRIVDAATVTGAKLIIVDYLGAISGGADENSSEMIRVMSGLRWIAEMTGTAIVIIHHKTKTNKTRAGHSLRGHSSIEGAVDLALLIEREEGADSITVKSTKSRDAPVEPFEALWTYESDGRDLVEGRFYGLGVAENEADGDRRQAREAILEVLEETPGLSQRSLVSEVRENTDLGKGIITFALKQLVKEGKVSKEQGERKHWYSYSLA